VPRYDALREHYENCLEQHGDNHLGVNWPRQEDALKRYEVMLDMLRPTPDGERISVLDFGCGAAHFYEYLIARGRHDIDYVGLDISQKFIALSRHKHPALTFYCLDFLLPGAELPQFDYIVLNGVFTAKATLGFEEMWTFCRNLLRKLRPHARRGVAFNVMTKHVDWERDDLFHLPFDTLGGFLRDEQWQQYTLRSDYGLYDYTAYLYS
jgi:SAM-dependent methyltransferase